MTPIEFDTSGSSADRGTTVGALITRETIRRYRLTMNDSHRWHAASLLNDWSGWVGECSCKAWEYHNGPCAHLYALRRADDMGVIDIADVSDLLGDQECPHCGEIITGGIYEY